jgi:hypothetical protein
MPAEVDEMLLEHSSGWLLEQMVVLDANPDEWRKQLVGFYDDDADDEWSSGGVEPPAGWERLPIHEEVSDEDV